ncbi:hypothetical protein ACH5RR_019792 [Cinchona calisaya]|uniref:Fungal lipase-type domain-containing protein n=1 Tax=Cinchona calisaya TaxID=153742 RepID=A0ABD2ZVN6_9GENT
MAKRKKQDFQLSGPIHLAAVDWENFDHRASIAASLVQGVGVKERDRQDHRLDSNALAPPWWEFFKFQLFLVLNDKNDQSVFACIYKLQHNHRSHPSAPNYVVAFRGTIKKPDTIFQDLKLDIQATFNRLEKSSRFRLGMKAVEDIVAEAGAENVWLAGHSLGSAIALLIGRNMVKRGFLLQTYLFNPPYISLPLELIKNKKFKFAVRYAKSHITARIATVSGRRPETIPGSPEDPFTVLSKWIPNLFVNPSDPVCCEYIGYFEHVQHMVMAGAGEIGSFAARNSILSVILDMFGKNSETFHHIPSAHVIKNRSPSENLKEAHGIHQWLRLNQLFLQHKLYKL